MNRRATMRGDDVAQDIAEAPPHALAAGASLFLDFDGTLVDIAERPEAVIVSPRVERLMDRLPTRFGGRVALLTGRSVDQIAGLLDIRALAIGGSHGIELRPPGGRIEAIDRPPALDDALAEMSALRERFPGILIENKPHGVALHFRQAPEAEEDARALAERLAARTGLALQPGKMLFELKSAATDKGTALATFLRAPPMAGTRPLFFGDDMTDEPGFAAAERLGGAGILVGPPRRTAARYRLDDVASVLAWLEAVCEDAA